VLRKSFALHRIRETNQPARDQVSQIAP